MKSMEVTVDLDSIDVARELVRQEVGPGGIRDIDLQALDLICDEMISNLMRHAYGEEGGSLRFSVSRDGFHCTMKFVDSGAEFDPTVAPEPDIDAPLQERELGGLGVLLVRRMSDLMRYERRDGLNVVTVVKRLRRVGLG